MGLVEARHGRGYFVAERLGDSYRSAFSTWLTINLDELLDMLRVRGALTTLAGQRAIQLNNAVGIQGVADAHGSLLDAVKRGTDSSEIAELDVRFHRSIADASGSRLIANLLADLYDRLDEPRHAMMNLPGQPERSSREHKAIVDALMARDSDALARAVDEHIRSVCHTIDGYAQRSAD